MKTIERNMNNAINFCHIAPTPLLKELTDTNGAHLLLAHLVETDERYRDYYANLDDGKVKILDNSAFEMFKQGRPMYEPSKLIDMGKACNADVIVMSDYPKEVWTKTADMAKAQVQEFKDAGFQTFYVPQSEPNDLVGLLNSYAFALNNPDIDLIGVSILACPIALGVSETNHQADSATHRSDAYKLQRFLSRWRIFNLLHSNGLLYENAVKRFHCLGMTDGPMEVELLIDSGYAPFIYSWDSSAAPWAGLNGISFDNSPSGLIHGKFEKEVDFEYNQDVNSVDLELAKRNIDFINRICYS